MDQAQFKTWLQGKDLSEEVVRSISDLSIRIEKVYEGSVRIGGAIPHGDWLEEITSDFPLNKKGEGMLWLLLTMSESIITFLESIE